MKNLRWFILGFGAAFATAIAFGQAPTIFNNIRVLQEIDLRGILTNNGGMDPVVVDSDLDVMGELTVGSCVGCGGGSPAGMDGEIQFNEMGGFAASSNLIWDDTLNILGVDGGITLATGPLLIPNGTSANPSIAFASDVDLGLYRVGADNLGLTGRVRIPSVNTAALHIGTACTPSNSFALAVVCNAGSTTSVVRNSANNVEAILQASFSNVFIGAQTAHSLQLMTGGSNRLELAQDGAVRVLSTFSTVNGGFRVGNTGSTAGSYNTSVLSPTSASSGWRNSTNSVESAMIAGASSVSLGSVTNHPLSIITNNVERIGITNAGAVTVAGDLTVNGTCTGCTTDDDFGQETLTFTNGCDGGDPDLVIYWYRIGRSVTWQFNPFGFSCTSDSTAWNTDSAAIPASIRPASGLVSLGPVAAVDNTSGLTSACIEVGNDGTISISKMDSSDPQPCVGVSWTASGTKSLDGPVRSFSYLVGSP